MPIFLSPQGVRGPAGPLTPRLFAIFLGRISALYP